MEKGEKMNQIESVTAVHPAVNPATDRVKLSPLDYSICKFIYDNGSHSVLLNTKALGSMLGYNSGSVGNSAVSLIKREILQKDGSKITGRRGKPSSVLSLVVPFGSLEMSERKFKTRQVNLEKPALPVIPEKSQLDSTIEALEILFREREELKTKVSELESQLASLKDSHHIALAAVSRLTEERGRLIEENRRIREAAEKREGVLAKLLSSSPKTVKVDASGVVVSVS